MELNEIISREHEVVMPTYSRFNLALDHGEGALLYDVNGKEYIDLTSGIGVNSLGHNHPILTKNLENQIHKVLSTSNLYYTLPMIEAAEKWSQILVECRKCSLRILELKPMKGRLKWPENMQQINMEKIVIRSLP